MSEFEELDDLFAAFDEQEKDTIDKTKAQDQEDSLDELFRMLTNRVSEEATLKDKTIVVTGKLQNYTRAQVTKVITERGGHCPNTVTLNTVALVVGDKPGMVKVRRAVELGLPILDEDQFMNLAQGLRSTR